MAVTALVLYLTFCAVGFGWRSWRQYRRTGSTGFRGIGGRVGSLEWIAGVGFVVALLAGAAAPTLQLFDVLAPLDLLHHPWIQGAGLGLAVLGIAATVYAQNNMGDSWRIGVDPSETTTLVHSGVFATVRNPIFTSVIGFGVGAAMMTPNPLAIAALIILVATVELQVRVVEEPYLRRTHGDAYCAYSRAVGRFVPGIGRS